MACWSSDCRSSGSGVFCAGNISTVSLEVEARAETGVVLVVSDSVGFVCSGTVVSIIFFKYNNIVFGCAKLRGKIQFE